MISELDVRNAARTAPAEQVYLSAPDVGPLEAEYMLEALRSGWAAPVGPHLAAFEQEVATRVGRSNAVAVSSGTAALHLALLALGVGRGQLVVVPTLTFVATANAVAYTGAEPVFVDCDPGTGNVDVGLLADVLHRLRARGARVGAVIPVDVFGACVDYGELLPVCEAYGVPVVEDAAEALGAAHGGRAAGSFGRAAVLSFNGNKIITTSGGGMLVTDDEDLARHARKLATQARDDAPHYEHSEIGYNYRMSNVLAGIGRGQLQVLEDRVRARRRNFAYYERRLGELPGIEFMPEAPWGRHTRWLTCLTIDPEAFGADREEVRLALEADNIEARPVWKPMHLQPAYKQYRVVGGSVSEDLFNRGLCLPSGSAMTEEDLDRVCRVVISCHEAAATGASVRAG